jgi:hypothetical protein
MAAVRMGRDVRKAVISVRGYVPCRRRIRLRGMRRDASRAGMRDSPQSRQQACVPFGTAMARPIRYALHMINMRFVALFVAGLALCSYSAAAQDLSRYRDVAFGSTVSSVVATTGTNAGAVKVIHQRPALIQELAWRPRYAVNRPAGGTEAVQEITFRFHDDQLFSVNVVYDARLVEGLTNADIIEAVSTVYGPATMTPAISQSRVSSPPRTTNGSTALARWQSADHEFTLIREGYPATFRLIGVSKRLEALARAADIAAVR